MAMITRRLFLRFGAALCGLVLLAATSAVAEPQGPGQIAAIPAEPQRLTVVELYSAQGCPLCPPAEMFLGELSKRDDLLPLAFHVDYWDYLGWPDRFADAGNARRQQRYADRLGLPYVYTPQMIIDGRQQASGSRRDAVDAGIVAARAEADSRVAVTLRRLSPMQLQIDIVAMPLAEPADIVLVGYDAKHRTEIAAGENRGITLDNYNVVREFKTIASWNGDRFQLTVPLSSDHDASEFCAVLVQQADQGRILGAARLDMRPERGAPGG